MGGATPSPASTTSLPFDQYQRYRLVADLVGRVRGEEGRPTGDKDNKGALRILDVGGRTALLRSFLPEDNVHLVDVEASDQPGLVLGDGGRLPFLDKSFDVVAAFDTLEHVPPQYREAFVSECARVCRGHVMIAGPYTAPRVDEAEELLKSFMLEKLGLRHRYLEEHRTYGLPDRAAVEAQFRGLGARVVSHGHANLDRWLVLMCMEMYLDSDPVLRPLSERFFRFYNTALYASDHAAPVYRHVVVAALDGSEPPAAEGLLEAPRMPEGGLAALNEFGKELLALDREKDVWRPEYDRLETVVKGLDKDLAEHQSSLEEARRDLAEHKGTLAELRAAAVQRKAEAEQVRAALSADLVEHERSLEAARAELVATRQTQERTAQEAAAMRAELEERVASEKAARTTLAADLAGHKDVLTRTNIELDEHKRVLAELRTHLDEHRVHAHALEVRVAELDEELIGAVQDRDDARALLAAARAELRDRWRSLKRAFGPKKPI